MPLYLCGESALEMWRYLRIQSYYHPETYNVCRKNAITNPVHTKRQLSELPYDAELLLGHISQPYHVLVTDPRSRHSITALQPHLWTQKLPRGTFVDLGNDLFLSSGPFLFLQLAAQLEGGALVKTGMELCGIYTRFATGGTARSATDPTQSHNSISGVPPVTTVARIARFLEGCAGQPGYRRAKQTLPHVLDNSGSPMETASYMLACMPKRYGSYGVSKPVLNPTLVVAGINGPQERRPDLYWPKRSVDVEYNSDLIHLAKDEYYKDARRQVELTAARVQVLPLTRDDVMSPDHFDHFVRNLAKVLGERLREFPDDWHERRDKLRQEVLFD